MKFPKAVATFVLIAGRASISAAPAWAWGCDGHQTIALVAEKHLTPNAKAMVLELLNNNPVDPTLDRYCKDQGPDAMTNAATWADDERSRDPSTSGWHFLDLPRGATRTDISKYCPLPDSCVTEAIRDQLAILKDSSKPAADRANALRFIIHFVGDLHQPLHSTTNNDRGANCIPVGYFGTKPHVTNETTESYRPNLHGTWDTNIIGTDMTNRQFTSVEPYADYLDKKFHSKVNGWLNGAMDLDGWAWSSHQAAERISYGKLPAKVPVEQPITPPITSCADDNHVSQRMLALNIDFGQAYVKSAAKEIEQRLEMAGVRLAMILNQLAP